MQQAFKTMMGQMNSQSNQFGNDGFPLPFPFVPSAASDTASSPPAASATATSPSQVASQPVTVDVSATKVDEPPATDIKDGSEPKKEAKKYGILRFCKV